MEGVYHEWTVPFAPGPFPRGYRDDMTDPPGGRTVFPARIHVLLARESPLAVVLRQGPSNQTCALSWDRRTDELRVGQWLRGRIYATRSDISPDGRHWIYFALNGKWSSEAKGSYTVLARTPYLRAIHLWPQGDTWGGGGLIVSDDRFTAFKGGLASMAAPGELVQGESITDHPWYRGGVYSSRLVRDGWTALDRVDVDDRHTVYGFERDVGRGWTLRKVQHLTSATRAAGKGIPYEEHVLVHRATAREVPLPDWEWADVDGPRLVWARQGCLFAGHVGNDGLREPKQLHDLNGMRFKRIQAPY